MPRRKLPELPGRHDPDSLACHMEQFLSNLAVRNHSPATIIDRRHILSNPASELELPRPEKRLPALVLTAEEPEAIMTMPDTSIPLGLRARAILELLYATVIRRSELVNLKIHDVD